MESQKEKSQVFKSSSLQISKYTRLYMSNLGEDKMQKVGVVGWRGMVGSVLMDRFKIENDFSKFETFLFSTSLNGEHAPEITNGHRKILDSDSIDELSEMDIIVTCQGGDYTKAIHPKLRKSGWSGVWIDAASALRMEEDAIIVLDPINRGAIEAGLNSGTKDFAGGNCTVSLMLMALGGLFKENLIEWVSSMTYQAASGAGAKSMLELLEQMQFFGDKFLRSKQNNAAIGALDLEKIMNTSMQEDNFPNDRFGGALGLSLLPWIDTKMESGQSKEEWKAQVEANKILQSKNTIPIDGTCVRVGALRCHSQAFTIKLNKSVAIKTVEELIRESNPWVELVENDKQKTLDMLTPACTSGTLKIPVGRVRHMSMGDDFVNAFSVGDQLLWGAAEPLRRTLLMCL